MLKNTEAKHPSKLSNKRGSKSSYQKQELTPEQLAQDSLLEISHFQFEANDRAQQPSQVLSGYHPTFLTPVVSKQLEKTPRKISNKIRNPIKNSFSQQIHSRKSTQLRSDVSYRISSPYRPLVKQPSSEIYTDHVCVFKKTMALNLEPFFRNEKSQQECTQRVSPPKKPSKIYFRGAKNGAQRHTVKEEEFQKAESKRIKLGPLREAYMKFKNNKTYYLS